MSFFRGNEQLDVLTITGQYNPGTTTLTGIKLPNNETLELNLGGLKVKPSNPQITNVDQIVTLKVVIDWGDGNSDSVSPYFHVSDSTINVKYKEWSSVSHTYSLYTEQPSLTLTIYVYNSLNDCAILTVPITMQYQSLLESGAKFHLVSANITNDNKVSYVFNNSTEKSNFVVSTIK